MSEHKIKRHNKSLLLYHLVFPLKYRRKAISKEVGGTSNEEAIREYVKNQGREKEYKKSHQQ